MCVGTIGPDCASGPISAAAARGGWRQRLERARNSITGRAPAPLLISLSTPADIITINRSQVSEVQQAMRGVLMRNQGFVADLARVDP